MSWGFNQEEETNTELEKTFGFTFTEKDREPYNCHIGKPVTVHLENAQLSGVYRGLNEHGYVVLLPAIIAENYPDRKVYRWETERPDLTLYRIVTGISPARQEYLDELVNFSKQQPAEKSESK